MRGVGVLGGTGDGEQGGGVLGGTGGVEVGGLEYLGQVC